MVKAELHRNTRYLHRITRSHTNVTMGDVKERTLGMEAPNIVHEILSQLKKRGPTKRLLISTAVYMLKDLSHEEMWRLMDKAEVWIGDKESESLEKRSASLSGALSRENAPVKTAGRKRKSA